MSVIISNTSFVSAHAEEVLW